MLRNLLTASSILSATVFLLLTGGAARAVTVSDYPAGIAASGIMSSRHNMGSLGRVITTDATTQVCVFCHTPHFANETAGVRPIWNRATQVSTSYTAYGTTSAGTTVTSTDLGSTTLACLSCHDGVSTFDSIVNAPGKGGIVAGGQDRGWGFKMPPSGFSPSTSLDHFDTSGGGMMGGTCSSMMCHQSNPAIRLSVGVNLSDDHPVSIPYDASNPVAGLRSSATVISSIDLTGELNGSASTLFDSNLAQNRWAVKGMISTDATIEDLLIDGKVECSSCHDPHFRNLSWDEAEDTWAGWSWCDAGGAENCSDGNFLRRVGGNTGSAVCRTCHDK